MRVKKLLSALLVVCAVRQATAADFTVTNTLSAGPGSLYQAITDANNTPGADRILFNIPGTGVEKIDASLNPLPRVTESLVIDGYSQPGAKPNSLSVGDNAVILIQIDGGKGLVFEPSSGNASSNYTVRGLCLTGHGTAIIADVVDSLVVTGNFIGILPDGETAKGNGVGVGHVTQLGGTDPASRNIISGNEFGFTGELLSGTPTPPAVVQGNYIGTNASGTKAVPNYYAIALDFAQHCETPHIDLSKALIGGTTPGAGNLISGNTFPMILGGSCSLGHSTVMTVIDGLRIKGNLIGVQADGVSPLPNCEGLEIPGDDNVIGGEEAGAGNVIAFNAFGVSVGGVRNRILSNTIYGNWIGIDLGDNGPTPNDAGDADQGPNGYQNNPVIDSAEIANGMVTIKGTLNSTADSQFTLQYFSESLDLVRPFQTYLGSSSVTTDSNGNAQFSASFPVNDTKVSFNMTATSQDGNTSEFSRNPARFRNISTRAVVGTGDQVAIAGFIVRRYFATSYPIVVRALGPSLQSSAGGIGGALQDPILELYDSTGKLIASNNNWRDDSSFGSVGGAGLAPPNDLESALWRQLEDGSYTAVVREAGGDTGIGLVEVYDLGPSSELANISTRGIVRSGDGVMIAGVILEQTNGSQRLVARALGPSLANFGIANPLADPVIELHDSQGALINSNDNWRDGQPDDLMAVGLAPSNDKESAIFALLPSGVYTAIVSGKNGATGIGLVELYNLH
jgi:hypothetical protein